MEQFRAYHQVPAVCRRAWRLFCVDSLLRNSVYLMLSTLVISGLGFVFWVVVTHHYPPAEIGYATALISTASLIANLSLLGFNVSLIRYLPRAAEPGRLINTAFFLVASAAFVLSALYLGSIEQLAPAFAPLKNDPLYAVLFAAYLVFSSLSTLTDSIFIAWRSSKYNLVIYTIFGLIKLVLPLLLIALGAYGIFFSFVGAVSAALLLSVYLLIKKFHYRPALSFDRDIARRMVGFSVANYAVTFLAGLPALIAPALILAYSGPEEAAYFYMASTIASLLNAIPVAITQSLFAEGSNSMDDFVSLFNKAARLTAYVLLAAVVGVFAFGRWILLIFGARYSDESYGLLLALAFATVFMSANLLIGAHMRVHKRMRAYVAVNAAYMAITLVCFWFLVPSWGAAGICWSLLGGQAAMLGLCLAFYRW